MNSQAHSTDTKNHTRKLALSALGVVFGDIGTSPLYAVQQCFAHGLTPEPTNIVGVISLIVWGLTIVVSLKYVLLIMRADNNGQGGVFSLLALTLRALRRDAAEDKGKKDEKREHTLIWRIMLIGMFGAALFFGDSIVTPAISVLSAVEGLDVAAPHLHDFVMPIAIAILITLFILQRFGSQRIGNSFGPIMVGWFSCLAVLGFFAILKAPVILYALNPLNALRLIVSHGWLSFSILGAVLLAFTGGEALYADMGHFGLKPIRLGWYCLVMPSLVINYMGQGALILADPTAVSNPFYLSVPTLLIVPMIVLAAVATVIASQAVISGTFSLVRQAIQMEYLPRFSVVHTSSLEQGQVYLPRVNLLLCLCVVMLVLIFRSSDALAGAYGFAVGGAMLIDTLLAAYVARHAWHWSEPVVAIIFAPFLIFDITFFTTATAKIPEGGWLPLGVGLIILTIFTTWKEGREIVRAMRENGHKRLETFVAGLESDRRRRPKGTSVYLAPTHDFVPPALTSALKRYQIMRENIVVLTITKEDEPHVPEQYRAKIHPLGKGFWQVSLRYGFIDRPNVATDLRQQMMRFSEVDMENLTFFVGRSIFVKGTHKMTPPWRKDLFLWLANSVEEEYDYSHMPSEQLVQIGAQIDV